MRYYILEGRTPKPTNYLLEWAEWMETANRKLARNEMKDTLVSTVFLGLNHQWGDGPPLLFETMIFGGEHDGEQWRYSTWEEAEEGHRQAVNLVKQEQEDAPV